MPSFSLDAGGAQALGQGLGNLFKAAAMAPHNREVARMDAAMKSARAYQDNMQGNLAGSKAAQEAFTLDQRQSPIEEGLPQYLQHAQRLFQMTGDTNAERVANAGTAVQTQGIRDQALAAVDDIDRMNRLNTLAKPGEVYMPHVAVGNSGRSLNKATGEGVVLDDVMARLFDNVQATDAGANQARAAASYASANNSNASAGAHTARRDLILQEGGVLRDTGKLPGRAGSGEDATNAKARNQIIRDVEKHARDFGLTGEETDKLINESLARHGIGAGQPAASAGGKVQAVPAPAQRVRGTVYQTPRGPMTWTGTGWLPAN